MGRIRKIGSAHCNYSQILYQFLTFTQNLKRSRQTTPVLKVPMSVMYFSLVLTFALILVIQAVVLVEKVMDLKNKEVEA